MVEPYPGPLPADEEELFRHPRLFFSTGLRAGETAHIRTAGGETVLTYRSFAHVTGIIAALVAAIVALAGLAGAALLVAEKAPLRAAAVLVLTAVFTVLIARLVPRTSVTLHEGTRPVLSIVQTSLFPTSSFTVTSNGHTVGELTRGPLARLARNRWSILQEDRLVGEAWEEPLGQALARKLLGKFSRRWEADVRIESGGLEAGTIRRRPDASGQLDYLETTGETLDPRLAVALATVILGSEP